MPDPRPDHPEDDPTPGRSGRSSVNINPDLLAVARGAVRLVRRKTGRAYSLQQFTNEAVTAQIQAIADTYNDGRPIPPDEVPLEKGTRGG